MRYLWNRRIAPGGRRAGCWAAHLRLFGPNSGARRPLAYIAPLGKVGLVKKWPVYSRRRGWILSPRNCGALSEIGEFLARNGYFAKLRRRRVGISLIGPLLEPAGGGGPPVNTTECFRQGPRACGWLRFGLLRCLWLFRVCGGFVCPFSLVRLRRWSFVFGLGRGRWFRF